MKLYNEVIIIGEVELTQDEINKLIYDMNNNVEIVLDVKKKQIKEYDFLRPSKINKEQLKTLGLVFEHYCRLVSSYTTMYLNMSSQMSLVSTEELSFSEFYNAVGNISMLGFIHAKPLGEILLNIPMELSDVFIDRMLGGSGKPIKRKTDFTEIEKNLISRTVKKFTELLIEPFDNIIKLEPEFYKLETNKQFAQIIPPRETIILVTLEITLNNISNYIHFCIPATTLAPIMDKLKTNYQYNIKKDEINPAIKQLMKDQIEKTKIPVTTVLFETDITISDFSGLEVGDVILSDNSNSDPSYVFIGNLLKFYGYPCTKNNHYGVKIHDIIEN